MNLRRFSTLQWALAISVLVHALVLSVRFIDPEGFRRVFQDSPMDVILVNAKSPERPDKAQAHAQHSLVGGGDAASGRATTPLPPSLITDPGDSMEESKKKIDTLQARQTLLLGQLKQQLSAAAPPDSAATPTTPEAKAEEEKRRQLLKLLAVIERRVNEQNARPRKHYISASTQAVVYALYYDKLRQAIEHKGTENFPRAAGNKLYGELTMIIFVNHDGRVLATEVVQGSGNATLDRQAQAIARSAAPFGRFSPAMRHQFDQYAVIASFRFTHDEVLNVGTVGP